MWKPTFALLQRHRWSVPALIFSISFAVRFAMLTTVPHAWIVETGEVSNIAHAILNGQGFANPYITPTGPTAHANPFYPALVAGIAAIAGEGYAGALVRCGCLIAAYSLLYALFPAMAERIGMPRSAGIAAGFAAAVFPVKRSAELYMGWEAPYAALALMAALVLLLNTSRRPGTRPWLAFGAVVGLSLYVSASLAIVFGAWAVVDLLSRRSRAILVGWVLAGAMAMLLIAPWLLRDHLVFHHWVFLRDNLPLELRYSNHDDAAPSGQTLLHVEASNMLHPYHSREEAAKVARLGEYNYNRLQSQLASSWIRSHPGEFATLTAQRVWYFWFASPEHKLERIETILYTLLGLCGLWTVRRRCGKQIFYLFCAALATFPLVYYVVQYIPRYRIPIDWMVWLSAGLFTVEMVERRRARLR